MSSPTPSPAPALLAGRVVLVTGAGQGIGAGIAAALAEAGASVCIATRRAATGVPTAEGLRNRGLSVTFVRCDVGSPNDVAAAVNHAVETYGGLDAVIHNAVSPSGRPGPIQTVDNATISDQISTSTTAAFAFAREAHRHLKSRKGTLILLTSPAGIEGSANLPMYATVKGALRGLLKSLAREWGPDGVRVNAIAPVAWTPALKQATTDNPELQGRLESNTPMGKIGDPEADIGPVAVFLVSDMARHITGQTIAVDGGRFLGL